jgi:hypothetical protein
MLLVAPLYCKKASSKSGASTRARVCEQCFHALAKNFFLCTSFSLSFIGV